MIDATDSSRRERLAVAGIVPLYNKRGTVLEAVESMLAQARLPDEIVIVDDGSTDGSADLVEQRYGRHPLVRLVRQTNRGVSAARNAAIAATTSPLLAFLDADDRWLPQKLEKQAALMEAKADCAIVFAAAVLCDEKRGSTWVEGARIVRETYLAEFFREEHLPVCSGVMVRRAALDEVGTFDESLRMGEDHDLWLRIMLRFPFEHLAEPAVWYRCCRPQTLESVENDFRGNDVYFAKHRFTFGRGVRGRVVWRTAYASVLRRQATWYFRNGHGRKALAKLLKAVWTWPFFNPSALAKCGLEYLLGPRAYGAAVSMLRWRKT
jgi:glycosyltransferase involved in cell wall biosynthesis